MKVVNTKPGYRGHYSIDICEVKDGEKTFDIEVFKIKNGVSAMVFDTVKNKWIFISQYRASIDSGIIELVGGGIEEGDTPYESIEKEILEETGYMCDDIQLLTEFYSSPGCSVEKNFIYLVKVSRKWNAGGGVNNEKIEILEIDDFDRYGNIEIGNRGTKLIDAKALLGCAMLAEVYSN